MNELKALDGFSCWHLHRVSPKTFARDLGGLSGEEINAVVALMLGGDCYRCRIASGRFYYGSTAQEAIEAAIAAQGQKRAK